MGFKSRGSPPGPGFSTTAPDCQPRPWPLPKVQWQEGTHTLTHKISFWKEHPVTYEKGRGRLLTFVRGVTPPGAGRPHSLSCTDTQACAP